MGETQEESSSREETVPLLTRFGLTLEEGYQSALDVYRREKDGASFSYSEKVQMSALLRQCIHGVYTAEKCGDVGFFDFVGNDRRKAWQRLGDMSQSTAKAEFCMLIFTSSQQEMENVCSKVQLAKQRAQEEAERKAKEEAERREAERRALEEKQRQAREEAERREEEEREATRQAALRAQQQQNQSLNSRTQQQQAVLDAQHQQLQANQQHQQQADVQQQAQDQRHGSDQTDGVVALATPEVWTRPDRTEFIGQMKQDPEAVILLGHGETVTVKAVTNPAGSRMFWEFATENYDIAFSVSFQWPAVDGVDGKVVEILSSERKPAHQVVIGGSHIYPGLGTYLIQFDNTYSVLRAKTLYYRVYYAS